MLVRRVSLVLSDVSTVCDKELTQLQFFTPYSCSFDNINLFFSGPSALSYSCQGEREISRSKGTPINPIHCTWCLCSWSTCCASCLCWGLAPLAVLA